MTVGVTVVVPDDQAERVGRIVTAAVWVDAKVAARIEDAPADRRIILVGDPEQAPGDPRIAFVTRAALPDDQLQALIIAIATGSALAAPTPAASPQDPNEARRAQLAFSASRKLAAASDLAQTEAIVMQAVAEMLDCERAQCLFYDGDDGSLWSEARMRTSGDDRIASTGLAGWSARTGLASGAAIAGDDPRFHAAVDDPDGDATEHILVQPILGADAKVHAVLVAVRRARRQPLGPVEAAVLARFAALAAPLLDQLSIHVEGQQLLAEGDEQEPLFRAEAIEAATVAKLGDVVRAGPGWLTWSYWLLVVLLLGTTVFVIFGRVSTYSSGPAVVRSKARTSITARTAGNIVDVVVQPGDKVAAGATIAQLDDVDQRAGVDRISHEFETQLRNHMLDLGDANADSQLRSLRLELDLARSGLAERVIRTATAGTISDVRVRPGQHVEPGDIAAATVNGDAGLEVVALLPGEDRPQLAPGMAIRLELDGYRYAYQMLVIESVSADVIAPNEARRVLGADIAETLQIAGPVVVVRGKLAGSSFDADGRTYQYHDGMLGRAEIRVHEERIVYAIVPGAKRF